MSFTCMHYGIEPAEPSDARHPIEEGEEGLSIMGLLCMGYKDDGGDEPER